MRRFLSMGSKQHGCIGTQGENIVCPEMRLHVKLASALLLFISELF